ncbi:MAG: hypothetical protein ACW98Y_16965, partial [Candidatus Thorarchaeota archaeon]
NDGIQATCPYCGNTFAYTQNDLNHDGTVACRGCGSIIETKRKPLAQSTEPRTTSGPVDPIFGSQTQAPKKGSSGTTTAIGIVLVLLFLPLIIAIPIAVCWGLYYMSKNKN